MVSCKYCDGDLELMTVVRKKPDHGLQYKGWVFKCPLCGRRSLVSEIRDYRKHLNEGKVSEMSDFKKGWYARDHYNNWYFIGNDGELAKYIMDLEDCGEEFAESIIQEDFDNKDSNIRSLIEDVVKHTLDYCHTHTKEDIYRMFLEDYILSITHEGGYPIVVNDGDVNHVFTWAECEEDLVLSD